jgi:hypothetical protein
MHWKPGRGPVTGFVGIHHRNVAITRGARFVHHGGRWRRLAAVTALAAPIAVIVVGGASFFADGYVNLAAPVCGGVTDAGCQLSMVDVPAGDGETVPQCVQYCPWDAAAGQPPQTPPQPASAVPVAPEGQPATEPPASAPTPPDQVVAALPAGLTAAAPDGSQLYTISIQSAPDAGGKCVDVPDQQFTPDASLQLWSCNGTSAQAFSYDAAKKNLAIGGLCVDNGGGSAQSGDPVRLAVCNGTAGQTWYIRQNGNYVEFVGVNERCMDVKDAATEDHTPLIAWPCHGQANQSWTMHPAAQAAAAK